MTVDSDWSRELNDLAPILRSMPHIPDARVMYDIMSDALIWADEKGECVEATWVARPLFRFRTSIIIGEPDERCAEYWRLARRIIPEWIGFRPERCSPSQQLRELYNSRPKCPE